MDRVGSGLIRSLYSTYVSYIPVSKFSYSLKSKSDSRGTFVEFLKFSDSGQVSLLVVKPGQSRGGHYHHTKTEKFFVVRGFAEFIFNNKFTGENSSLIISDENMSVVDTVPGWAHSVKNIGKTDLLIFLWASELFDLANPDTFSFKGV
jgi:UDP-2-acetamido-2,6-beta-L-arabino-hexul-4-ose reductase